MRISVTIEQHFCENENERDYVEHAATIRMRPHYF